MNKLIALGLAVLLVGAARAEDEEVEKKGLDKKAWKVGDVTREGLLHAPVAATTTSTPVVFAFHGHGGTARSASNQFKIHEQWPEAIVVYLQGLKTATKRDPQGAKPGWQNSADDEGGRDLKFFDAVLADLKKELKVDETKIFATGHSNGGGFTYLLWAERGEVLAAVGPSSSGPGQNRLRLKPKPAIHVAGEKDEVVTFEGQKKVIEGLKKLNSCAEKGVELGPSATLYPSHKKTPFVAFVHEGGHKPPEAAWKAIVRFFKEYETLPSAKE